MPGSSPSAAQLVRAWPARVLRAGSAHAEQFFWHSAAGCLAKCYNQAAVPECPHLLAPTPQPSGTRRMGSAVQLPSVSLPWTAHSSASSLFLQSPLPGLFACRFLSARVLHLRCTVLYVRQIHHCSPLPLLQSSATQGVVCTTAATHGHRNARISRIRRNSAASSVSWLTTSQCSRTAASVGLWSLCITMQLDL